MNDLYCKDFEFLNKDNQQAYENLKQVVLKRSRLDLEFLQKFIEFSSTTLGTTQYACAKYAHIYDKDNKTLNYTIFCAEYLGLSERTIQKLYQTYERFVIDAVDGADGKKTFSWAIPLFSDMSLTKIFELLPCSLEQLRNAYEKEIISANMTQKQLREYVKSLKDGYGQANKVLEQVEQVQQEDTDSNQSEQSEPKLKTYNKLKDIISYCRMSDFDSVKDMRAYIVSKLIELRAQLVVEFDLDIKDESLKLVND